MSPGSARGSRRRAIRSSFHTLPWIQLLAIVLFFAIPLLYFIYLPVSYSFDGTVFSHMLRYARFKHDWLGLVQVHHLLYFPSNYWLYNALEALFHYRVLEFFHLQLFSMLFGVATLFLLERMLKKAGLDPYLRLAGVGMVAFSYAFWLFSVDAEVHIPGLFFTMAGLHLLLSRRDRTWPLPASALCFALAAGFHLTNGLIVAAAFLVLLADRAPWRRWAWFFVTYAGSLLLMFGAYSLLSGKSVLAVFHAGISGIDVYSGYHIAYSQPLSWRTLLASMSSVKMALVTGSGMPAALLAAACLALSALGLLRPGAQPQRRFRRALLFWAAAYFLFFSFWDPGNPEFKIHVVVSLLLAALLGLSRLTPPVARTTGALLAIGLLGVNLIQGIKPQSEIANNTDYQVAQFIRRATPEKALVLITGRSNGYNHGKIYIPYFAGREVLILDWQLGKGHALPEIQAALFRQATTGRPLYTLEEIAAPGRPFADLLEFHRVPEQDRSSWAAAIRFVPVAALPGNHRLYRLEFRLP